MGGKRERKKGEGGLKLKGKGEIIEGKIAE
jgi:hypothetical protein